MRAISKSPFYLLGFHGIAPFGIICIRPYADGDLMGVFSQLYSFHFSLFQIETSCEPVPRLWSEFKQGSSCMRAVGNGITCKPADVCHVTLSQWWCLLTKSGFICKSNSMVTCGFSYTSYPFIHGCTCNSKSTTLKIHLVTYTDPEWCFMKGIKKPSMQQFMSRLIFRRLLIWILRPPKQDEAKLCLFVLVPTSSLWPCLDLNYQQSPAHFCANIYAQRCSLWAFLLSGSFLPTNACTQILHTLN